MHELKASWVPILNSIGTKQVWWTNTVEYETAVRNHGIRQQQDFQILR